MKQFTMLLGILYIVSTIVLNKMIVVQAESAEVPLSELEHSLKTAINSESWTNAAIFSKQLAVYFDDRKQYDKAVAYYEQSAVYWEKAGHPSWGIKNLIRADHIGTELDLYVETSIQKNRSLAKFEPSSGTYLGLFLAGKRENANPDPVKEIYGKNHAIYLTYTKWGQTYEETNTYFPMKFTKEAKENKSGIQIGFEPLNGLDEVVDGHYIRQFAREAKKSGVPVFLRFAGEMNGEWVPWSGDPQKYIEKFRLVHDIMEEDAPNVAMVWSPNFLPRHNIDEYYPGDHYVDWVGLSLYTIPYSHGEEVLGGNPIDYLKPLYHKYSYKPMMISEGAVSHYSYQLNKDYSQWAAGQIGNMYGFLPKMFPQIKAISYFNLDKRTTNYDNSNNNYDLGDSNIVDETYKRIIQHHYFIDELLLNRTYDDIQTVYKPLKEVEKLSGVLNTFAYVKLPLGVQPKYVAAYQGNQMIAVSYAQPWEMRIDFNAVKSDEPITLIVFDKNYKRLAIQNVSIKENRKN